MEDINIYISSQLIYYIVYLTKPRYIYDKDVSWSYIILYYIYISYRIKLLELTTTNILQIHYRYPILHIYIILIYTYIYTLSQSNMYIIQYYIWHMYIYIWISLLNKSQSNLPALREATPRGFVLPPELNWTPRERWFHRGKWGLDQRKLGFHGDFMEFEEGIEKEHGGFVCGFQSDLME